MSEISLTALTPLMSSQSAESESPKPRKSPVKLSRNQLAPIEPKQKPAALLRKQIVAKANPKMVGFNRRPILILSTVSYVRY